jgi:hypothetical protein
VSIEFENGGSTPDVEHRATVRLNVESRGDRALMETKTKDILALLSGWKQKENAFLDKCGNILYKGSII